MADAKQERILEMLKQRITQLEGELHTSNERLLSAMDQSEEYKRDMESLRTEAHKVVGQWEMEVTDVRRRLATSEGKLAAELRKREELQKELESQQKASTQCSQSLASQQTKQENLEKAHAEVTAQLAKCKADFAEAMQQIKEYEGLTATMQKELQGAAESEAAYVREIGSLRSSLTYTKGELETLRSQKTEISAQAEKLLHRISELKELNEKLCDDTEATQQHTTTLSVEMGTLKRELTELKTQRETLEVQVSQLTTEKGVLGMEVSRLTQALANSEAVVQQQLEMIGGLEKDVQELQDSGIVQAKFLAEFQQQKELLDAELATALSTKEETEAQLAAIKECYSAALVETHDLKIKAEDAQKELRRQLEKCKADMSEALEFSDHRYDSAMMSVRQLSFSLKSAQSRELLVTEQAARGMLQFAHANLLSLATHELAQACMTRITGLEAEVEEKTAQCATLLAEKRVLAEKCTALSTRASNADDEVSGLRKSLATLENKAAASAAAAKEMQEKHVALERDNSWLKGQVEAMRTELGDLDELLNANLNEMQAENEKHLAANLALQATVDELRAKEADYSNRIGMCQEDLTALQGEFAAQAKTLDLTENDLRASNDEVNRLQATLAHVNSRVEEAEQRITELTRANALLSSQHNNMKEQMKVDEEKHTLILADKRREIDHLRLKINQLVSKADEHGAAVAGERQARTELERSLAASKDTVGRLRSALEELKGRCGSDASSLKQLIAERDELIRSRDDIVERYNRLHDAFRNVKRETHGKVAEELRKMVELSEKQEKELQQLRGENITLKKSVTMFVTSAQPKAEAVFMERLNLTEGPLRHPKKRSVAKSTESTT